MIVNTQKPQGNRENVGKVALLASSIIIALFALVFFYLRANASGGEKASGALKQMKPSVRSHRVPSGVGQQ